MAAEATHPVTAQLVPLARLRPAPWNPRTIREPRFKNLCQSIQADPDFLWRRPVLAMADGTVYAGNMRLRAAQHLGWESVPAIVEDVPEQLAKERALRDNRGWGDDDDQALAELLYALREAGSDVGLLGFEDAEIDALLATVSGPEPAHTAIGHVGPGYDDREIHSGKLGYRVEAAWRAAGGLAIDLYSGRGQLAAWYQRRFARVLRIDRAPADGLDDVSEAAAWLASPAFAEVAESFDFIDFDDEGTPLREVAGFFAALPSRRTAPFVLCLTDGSGLNLKLQGTFKPALYALDGPPRQATLADYADFEELVSGAVTRLAAVHGWTAERWSSIRGSENNVVYQTWLMTRGEAG